MEKSKITREVSVFETPAVVPYPDAWPLSQKGWSFVRVGTALPSSQVPTTSPSTITQDPKGKGANPPQGAYAQDNSVSEGQRGRESGHSDHEDVTHHTGLNPGGAGAGCAVDDENTNDDSNPGPRIVDMDVDPASPRRSNRERKDRQPVKVPGPSKTKPQKPKGQMPSRKRQREPESANKEEEDVDPRDDVVPAIHQVHAKGVKTRKAILEDSLVKMEAVEVRYTRLSPISQGEHSPLPNPAPFDFRS